jgi:hypothetical protein
VGEVRKFSLESKDELMFKKVYLKESDTVTKEEYKLLYKEYRKVSKKCQKLER